MVYALDCSVTNGICWNGGLRDYEAQISVDLLKEELQILKCRIEEEAQSENCADPSEDVLAVYTKIQQAASDFLRYVVVYDACYTGTAFENLDLLYIKKLMEADVKRGYCKSMGSFRAFDCDWIRWQDEQNKHLSFLERAQYLENRFNFDFYWSMIDGLAFSVDVPDDIL